MSDAKQAWNEVGERFESWGKRVSDRYKESEHGDEADAKEAQRKLEEAAREVGDQLTRVFNALGDTIRDEEAKKDLKDAVRAIGEAVGATVSEAGDAIGRRVRSSDEKPEPDRPDAGDDAPAG
jgi:predicted transcriptional regulator